MYRSVLLFVMMLLSACSAAAAQPTSALLPTRAVVAGISEVAGIVGTAVPPNNLPPTWTPIPTILGSTPAPQDTPTPVPLESPAATPFLPTNTPRPTRTPTPTATSAVTATATRYISQIPTQTYSNELGLSKLGLHVIRNNDARINEFVRVGQPSVIKAMDNFGYVAEIKALSPRTIVVGRVNHAAQNYAGTPEDAARDFVEAQLDQYLANPAVDYWEGWNEPDPNMNNMPWFTRFEQERVRLLAQYGLRAAVGGFPAGVPELDEFALFLPAIQTALEYHGILTLHEYSAPDMTYLYGDPLPGYPAYPDRGSLTFRYRWYYKELLEPAGLVIPLVISEAGIDGIIGNRPGPDGTGWRFFQNYWVGQGWGATGPEAFINQLAWYDNGVRQDGYVIGFTVFTAGGLGQWLEYDINEILPELTAYVVSQQ